MVLSKLNETRVCPRRPIGTQGPIGTEGWLNVFPRDLRRLVYEKEGR